MPDQIRIDDFRLKGNASFVLREGWLAKGLRNVERNPAVFSSEDATSILGVGSAMVNSIRHWLLAARLIYRRSENRRTTYVLSDYAKLIRKHDPYFEDLLTLWLVHYYIATNPNDTTVWYLLFNHFSSMSFTDQMMEEQLLATFRTMAQNDFSVESFKNDCALALRTYVGDNIASATPEDNNICPLTVLGLFEKTSRNTYERTVPAVSKMDPLAVLYVILDNLRGEKGVPFNTVMSERGNAGCIFHLTPYLLNVCLDELQARKLLEFQRTSGLNMIYPKEGLKAIDVAELHYTGR